MIRHTLQESNKKNSSSRAVFWDRDGVISQLYYQQGHIDTPLLPTQVKLNFGIIEALKHARQRGFLNVLVSNQPGLALGKLSPVHMKTVQLALRRLLKKSGIVLDGEYYCYHHPHAVVKKWQKNCTCRKPQPGLLKTAAAELDIDLASSYLVGDGVADILAGAAAGCQTILLGNSLESGYLKLLQDHLGKVKPDYIIKRLPEITTIIT